MMKSYDIPKDNREKLIREKNQAAAPRTELILRVPVINHVAGPLNIASACNSDEREEDATLQFEAQIRTSGFQKAQMHSLLKCLDFKVPMALQNEIGDRELMCMFNERDRSALRYPGISKVMPDLAKHDGAALALPVYSQLTSIRTPDAEISSPTRKDVAREVKKAPGLCEFVFKFPVPGTGGPTTVT